MASDARCKGMGNRVGSFFVQMGAPRRHAPFGILGESFCALTLARATLPHWGEVGGCGVGVPLPKECGIIDDNENPLGPCSWLAKRLPRLPRLRAIQFWVDCRFGQPLCEQQA